MFKSFTLYTLSPPSYWNVLLSAPELCPGIITGVWGGGCDGRALLSMNKATYKRMVIKALPLVIKFLTLTIF